MSQEEAHVSQEEARVSLEEARGSVRPWGGSFGAIVGLVLPEVSACPAGLTGCISIIHAIQQLGLTLPLSGISHLHRNCVSIVGAWRVAIGGCGLVLARGSSSSTDI